MLAKVVGGLYTKRRLLAPKSAQDLAQALAEHASNLLKEKAWEGAILLERRHLLLVPQEQVVPDVADHLEPPDVHLVTPEHRRQHQRVATTRP